MQKIAPFLTMILMSKASFSLLFISTKPSRLLLNFQPTLILLFTEQVEVQLGLYCQSLKIADNYSLRNLLHQVLAMSIVLLAVIALPCAPTVHLLLPSCTFASSTFVIHTMDRFSQVTTIIHQLINFTMAIREDILVELTAEPITKIIEELRQGVINILKEDSHNK